jgi:hypothetical protein
MNCPNCQRPLTASTTGDPTHAPWLCQTCYLSWWNCELVPEIAAQWVIAIRAFPATVAASLRSAIVEEQNGAISGGGS